jgi:hypothetical protein
VERGLIALLYLLMEVSMPDKDSPNWNWGRLGFTIHRNGFRRTVFDTRGHKVCENAGYDLELAISSWLLNGAAI